MIGRGLLIFMLAAGAPMAAQAQAQAQAQATPAPAAAPAANPADVGSVDAILAALYGVISGDKGVARDWPRMRSLFHPDARLIPTGKDASGKGVARPRTVDGYITASEPILLGQGFHEVEIARKTERFGRIVHVWSTYEARHSLSDPKPLLRGINSIQLLDDGQRFWILNIAWSQETPETPIPAEYLPKGK
jgi:hypothetical protein